MHCTLAATQSAPSFPAIPLVIGLFVIVLGFAASKSGILFRPQNRWRTDWLSGYQGDGPLPGEISRENDPFSFYYIILCMYLLGALLILAAFVEILFF